jgi:hypothetical protein
VIVCMLSLLAIFKLILSEDQRIKALGAAPLNLNHLETIQYTYHREIRLVSSPSVDMFAPLCALLRHVSQGNRLRRICLKFRIAKYGDVKDGEKLDVIISTMLSDILLSPPFVSLALLEIDLHAAFLTDNHPCVHSIEKELKHQLHENVCSRVQEKRRSINVFIKCICRTSEEEAEERQARAKTEELLERML